MCAKKISQAALLTLSIFSFSETFAQSANARYEWGLNLGAYIYQGDLEPGRLGSLKTVRPGIGVTFARILTPSFSLRANFNLASLRGDETKYDPEYRKYRAFKFTNGVKELNVVGQWNILGGMRYTPKFEPYLFAGAGLSYMNVTRDFSGFISEYFSPEENIPARLAEDLTHSTRRLIAVVPAGGGIRYNLSSSVTLNTETTYRFTNSDYIDGYSIAANPDKKDNYLSQTIGVSFKIGNRNRNKMGCPVMVY
jgi:opacity protein-like surface antigen